MSASPGPVARGFFAWHARRVHEPRVARVAAALARRIGPAASLLDVGAGDGALALALARTVGATRVTGVDVLVRPATVIPVTAYDGATLPFEDGACEVVVLSDVLHHAVDPGRVLRESLRVASRVVAIKDHFRFGRLSAAILYAMDRAGNAAASVPSPGSYFSAASFADLVDRAGGRITSIEWPLRIHDFPLWLVTRDEHQFTAAVERAPTRS
jgi:SAM-dependent methyltransferase